MTPGRKVRCREAAGRTFDAEIGEQPDVPAMTETHIRVIDGEGIPRWIRKENVEVVEQ